MTWQWLVHPAAQCLTLALAHFLWQGALLAALANLLLRRMAQSSPTARYLLCLVTLILMICCPLATYLSLDAAAMPLDRPQMARGGWEQPSVANVLSTAPETYRSVAPAISEPPTTAAESSWRATTFSALQPAILIVYLTGVLLLTIRCCCGYLGTLWLRSAVEELSPEWTIRVAHLTARLGMQASARVVVSLHAAEAMAVGWLRPVVLLPIGWLSMLPADALEAVIAHELAHLRRFDLWTSLVQRAIETLLFYHPAVWWLSRRTTLEREMCCDELAVLATGQRLSYAKALETLGSRAAGAGPLLLATTFLGESDMNLLARVRQVLGLRPQREAGRAWPAGLAAVGLAVALFTIAALPARQSALADDDDREAKAERKEGDRRSPEAARREGGERERDDDARRRDVEDERRDVEAAKRDEARRREGDRPRGDNPPPRREGDRPPSALDRDRPRDNPPPRRDGDPPPPRRDAERGGPPRPGFPPPMADRDRELIELIRQLQREVAELRREVAQLRGGPRPGPREGDALRPGPRDGEGPRRGPRDGEDRKEGPRDGEERKDAPRDGQPRRDAPQRERD
jgi:beta-lactamase regulating signal transducer with metallopeptidase domain